MKASEKNRIINSFGGLFEDCSRCEALKACGGTRDTAPCGCVWPGNSGKRYQCDGCPIICRERKKTGFEGSVADFAPHLNAGSFLEQVSVHQYFKPKLPVFIPTNTHFISSETLLPLDWVGADIKMLFNARKKRPATLDPHFKTEDSTCKYLRVKPGCNLICVLNGKDIYLESFWGMKRKEAFEQLQASGFSLSTGPTFSVTDLTYLGTPVPYAHNSAMLMRHHRVMHEIQNAGMDVIPNIYWLDGDKRELKRWTEWLLANTNVSIISRDFSSTRNPKTVLRKLRELIEILGNVGRTFHVLIVGTGRRIAPLVIKELANAGHSGSIITSAPIQHAYRNVKYALDFNNRVVDDPFPDQTMPFSDLMVHNMLLFEKSLLCAYEGTKMAHLAMPNITSYFAQ